MIIVRFACLVSLLLLSTITEGQKASFTSQKVSKEKDLESVFGVVDIGNLVAINSEDLDYNAVLVEDGVIFTSTRGKTQDKNGKRVKSYKKKLSTLFYSRLEDGHLNRPQPLEGDVNSNYHESSASFTKDGKRMFFTRNNTKGKNKKGVVHLKIYSAEKVNGEWTNIEELSFNSDNFSTAHPSISPDGRRLYFASNRKGGFGGMDIYVSHFKRGEWQKPINVGPVINTTKNEAFPFISEDDILYFSSDKGGGHGGLDVYRSKKMRADSERTWRHTQNIGEPFNSDNDDFGFYINKEESAGLFTSGRDGGKGRDDIYFWQLKEKKMFQASVNPDDIEPAPLDEKPLNQKGIDVKNIFVDTKNVNE